MPAQTTNLFLLEDLEDVSRTRELAESDLDALHAVADWIKTFVVKPHKDLGRAGTVCPFVPGSLERKTLWLAPEQIADRGVPEVVELMNGYKRLFLDTQPTDGDDADLQRHRRCLHRLAGGSCPGRLRRRPPASCSSVVCGRWNPVRAVLRRQRGDCDIQLELPTIPVARAVSVREAWGHQRLEVLPGQRGLAQLVGASLWRVRSPGSC